MKITIVTATRNNGATLEATLRSVAEQKNVDVDHVIVDGASTDESIEIIERWQQQRPERIRYISERDSGVYSAINKGIAMAQGDIIGILHGNDRFTSDAILEQVARAFEDEEVKYVYGDIHYVNPKTGKRGRIYSAAKFTPQMLINGIAPPHPTLYIRREVMESIGPYKEDYLIAADFDLFIRLNLVEKIYGKYLDIDMVEMNSGGLSTQLYHRIFTNNREKMRALCENSIKFSIYSILKRYLYALKF